MADYSVSEAFQQIEEYLISSMIRNMARHLSEEQREGFRYTQWQAEQLAALAEYRTANEKRFKGYFSIINESIELALRRAHQSGKMAQEAQILEALKRGWDGRRVSTGGSMTAEFFRINEEKLTAYIKAVVKDMERAETALLRMADDQYRKTIFNAGVAYNTGAYTLPQAIDAATKDYLSRGLACIEYRNGARVLIDTYAEMALRTSVTRSYLMGESAKRDEWGVNTVIVARRGAACPKCLQYVGRVFYDDVYGSIPVPDDKYPRLSSAIEGGLYHPNCKDIHTTYFEGVSAPPKPLTSAQEKRAAEIYDLEQRQRYNERQIRKYRRLAENTLDPEQKQKYTARLKQWQQVNADFVEAHGDVLKRRYEREDIRELTVRVEKPPVAEEKTLDKSAGSGIINVNRAKVINIFNDNNLKAGDPTPADIENELLKSSIGREIAELLPELPENIILTHGDDPDVRGEEKDGRIYIYVNNCKNIQWVARTIIHEYTHYRYGIGDSQWAECVCIAQELKHARNREYLTIAEKRTIINAVKSDPDYKKLNWRKGGFINGRRKSY